MLEELSCVVLVEPSGAISTSQKIIGIFAGDVPIGKA
jgi:hypothetical protein